MADRAGAKSKAKSVLMSQVITPSLDCRKSIFNRIKAGGKGGAPGQLDCACTNDG